MIVEDIEEVRYAIIERMKNQHLWECACETGYFEVALRQLIVHKPELLFLDYSILGGNSFMLLDHIRKMTNYNPYIAFFTGYMSDQPEIAEQILNTYKVDLFLNKPIFPKLTIQLDSILSEAYLKNNGVRPVPHFWIETIDKIQLQLNPQFITCIFQGVNPRHKIITMESGLEYEIKANWSECEKLLASFNQDFDFANTRYYYVNKKQIIRKKRPFLWLRDGKKVEVTKERWNRFNE